MKTLIFWLALLLFGFQLAEAQSNWQSLAGGTSHWLTSFYADTAAGLLYVGGDFEKAGGMNVYGIATWDGQSWGKVGNGTGDTNCVYGCMGIRAMAKFNGDLFGGGPYYIMDGIPGHSYFNRWDGQRWDTCGNPESMVIPIEMNGELFGVGVFNYISGKPVKKIAKWNGSSWDRFTDSIPFSDVSATVGCASYYQGQYYFGGNFENGNYHELVAWNDGQWNDLGGGVRGDATVNALTEYKDLLFVGGYFSSSAGNIATNIMAWDGNNWIDPFPGVYYTGQIRDMQVIRGVLYIVGTHQVFDGSTWQGDYEVAKYDGSTFCSFGGKGLEANCIGGLRGKLYVGMKQIVQGTTINYCAKWLGGDSTDICISQPVRTQDRSAPAPRVTLAPNPAQSHITLTLPQGSAVADLQIHDVAGRLVVPTQPYRAGEQVDVAALPAGLYFVEVRMRGRVEVLKMIKE